MKRVGVALVLLGLIVTSVVLAAQNCSSAPPSWGDTSAYESWCRSCGGTISGSGPRIQCNQGPNWGKSGSSSSSSTATSAAYNRMYQASYQLGYALGQWLFGRSNPQAEAQKQLTMAELQRRRAEAERQNRAEEARRLAEIFDRLSGSLKLSGVPNLQLKDMPGVGPGLKLKLGDSTDGQAGIKGLPGMTGSASGGFGDSARQAAAFCWKSRHAACSGDVPLRAKTATRFMASAQALVWSDAEKTKMPRMFGCLPQKLPKGPKLSTVERSCLPSMYRKTSARPFVDELPSVPRVLRATSYLPVAIHAPNFLYT